MRWWVLVTEVLVEYLIADCHSREVSGRGAVRFCVLLILPRVTELNCQVLWLVKYKEDLPSFRGLEFSWEGIGTAAQVMITEGEYMWHT